MIENITNLQKVVYLDRDTEESKQHKSYTLENLKSHGGIE